jgi:hypothetical protein
VTWFRYVRHADIPDRENQGWVVVDDLGQTHGAWSVLMEWRGEGEPT